MADKRRVRGLAIHRPIVYGSVATVLPPAERILNPDHNMRWTVAVRSATSPPPESTILQRRLIPGDIIGGCDDLSYFIKKVSFKLHDSYPNPLRIIDKPPFELSETGWGEFIIYIKIHFVSESGEKPIQLQHGLKLHDWVHDPNFSIPKVWLQSESDLTNSDQTNISIDGNNHKETSNLQETPIHSWQYDEIVFSEPTENFYNKLLANPPTPLPFNNRFPVGIVKQISNKGESGELTIDIAKNEFKKLNWSELKILMEIDRLKGKLSKDEKELFQIKKSLQLSN